MESFDSATNTTLGTTKDVPLCSILKHSESSLGLLDYEQVVNASTDCLTRSKISQDMEFAQKDIKKIFQECILLMPGIFKKLKIPFSKPLWPFLP